MASEIERKFLVVSDGWGPSGDGSLQRQGYLSISERGTVRVRVADGRAVFCVKGAQRGLTRSEYEWEIDLAEGEEILANLCEWVVEKTRYVRTFAGKTWEVDVFHGENDGLVVAEVELASEDEHVELPDWVGEDISHDVRFRAAALSRTPYSMLGFSRSTSSGKPKSDGL